MSDARGEILDKIRATAGGNDGQRARRAHARMATPPDNLIPDRGQGADREQRALFEQMAVEAGASVTHVDGNDALPREIARYLADHNLPSRVKAASDPLLAAVPWSDHPALTVDHGIAEADDQVGLAVAVAGVAETGTLVLTSGPANPTTINFLPETHIVVLAASRITGAYEAVWQKLRGDAEGSSFMPRTVNWITGPSRTGDIEQILQIGVHGPRRLHIVIVDQADG